MKAPLWYSRDVESREELTGAEVCAATGYNTGPLRPNVNDNEEAQSLSNLIANRSKRNCFSGSFELGTPSTLQ